MDLTPIQRLRKAAIEGDYLELAIILEEIGEEGILNPGGIAFENLMSAGLVLKSRDRHDLALEVFELLVMLFPEYPFSHVYLGDVYVEMGEMELAGEAYLKAIKLDSWFSSVVPEFAHSAGSE